MLQKQGLQSFNSIKGTIKTNNCSHAKDCLSCFNSIKGTIKTLPTSKLSASILVSIP